MSFETKQGNDSWFDKAFKPIRDSLSLLENEINPDKWIIKQPTLKDWAVIFDYRHLWQYREIVIRKKSNGNYSVRIKKMEKLSNWNFDWKTQKNGDKDTFDFFANDKSTFNNKLWAALDKIIGKNRDKLPNTWWKVYDLLNNSNNREVNRDKTNLKIKPIDLKYKEINKEKKVEVNFPSNQYSVEWRVTRCLRFSSITDAVEDRYWIPRWLLMALMAQEWWWDPTVINQKKWWKCDWWAWLIHMQATNAANFWLKTLQRSNNGMIDYEHGKRLQEAKRNTKNNLKELSKLDDRFNPVLSVDASARFLLNEYNNLPQNKRWIDRWLHAVNKYAWRWMADYWYSIVVYWTTINTIRNNENKIPKFSEEIEKVKKWKCAAKVNDTYENVNSCIARTKNTIRNANIKIDWEPVSLLNYRIYLNWQRNNFGLSEYNTYNKKHPYIK